MNNFDDCDHLSICYSKEELFFKCKNCGVKLIFCDNESYRMFCGYLDIPVTKLITKH